MGTRHRIDRAFIRSITPSGKDQAFQDAELTGFGIKVSPVGTVAYTYKCRWKIPAVPYVCWNILRTLRVCEPQHRQLTTHLN